LLRVLAALADPLVLERVPGAGLLDDPLLDAGIEDRARLRDALAVNHVELGLAERRRELDLHDLHRGTLAQRVGALLHGFDGPAGSAAARPRSRRASSRRSDRARGRRR